MRKLLSVAVAVVAAVLLMGNAGSIVSAQSSGLGITPRKDLVIQPGTIKTEEISVNNLNGTEELNLTLQIIDFGAKDETGTPALRLEADAPQTSWSLKPFLKAPDKLKVAPGKAEKVKLTINIPKEQGAGSYYSAVRYVAEGSDEGQVAISASGATLVFVTVPGKTKESLVLQKFGAYSIEAGQTDGKYRSLFVKSQPDQLAYNLKNQGNVAEQPAGSIVIKNMFGKQVKLIEDANPRNSLALIDQNRRFQVCIDKPSDDDAKKTEVTCKPTNLLPGRYTATLNVFYGLNGNQTQEVLTDASFWYLPVWSLIVLAVVLLALAAGIWLIYRRVTGSHGFKRR
jgi:hypothetical protein